LHFPLSVMLPPVSAPPAVTSVLDVQHEFFPEFFPRAEVAYRKAAYLRTVRRSRLVITISEHAAATIRERLAVPRTKLRPIHLGIDHERFRPGPEEREDFLLYPARPWPHKNQARLFDPESPEAIAAAVRDVLAAPEEWRAKGLARAGRFTWEATAQAHEAVYRELL